MPECDFHGIVCARVTKEFGVPRTGKLFVRRGGGWKREKEERGTSAPLEGRDHLGRDDPGESAELTGTVLPS